MEYYSGIKKNEIMPFVIMLLDLESIRLSEISQTKRNLCFHLYDSVFETDRDIQNRAIRAFQESVTISGKHSSAYICCSP